MADIVSSAGIVTTRRWWNQVAQGNATFKYTAVLQWKASNGNVYSILSLASSDILLINVSGYPVKFGGDIQFYGGNGTGGTLQWASTNGALTFATAWNLITSAGNLGLRPAAGSAVAYQNAAEGGTASMNVRTAQQAVTLSGASTDSTINIPAGAILLGTSFCVNTAVTDSAGDDTWSAAYVGGATTALATGAAAAQNTKVNTMVVPEKASAQTNIRFTPNGGNFTAGVIELVSYYIDLTSLANV